MMKKMHYKKMIPILMIFKRILINKIYRIIIMILKMKIKVVTILQKRILFKIKKTKILRQMKVIINKIMI